MGKEMMNYYLVTGRGEEACIEGVYCTSKEAKEDKEWLGEGKVVKASSEEEAISKMYK